MYSAYASRYGVFAGSILTSVLATALLSIDTIVPPSPMRDLVVTGRNFCSIAAIPAASVPVAEIRASGASIANIGDTPHDHHRRNEIGTVTQVATGFLPRYAGRKTYCFTAASADSFIIGTGTGTYSLSSLTRPSLPTRTRTTTVRSRPSKSLGRTGATWVRISAGSVT